MKPTKSWPKPRPYQGLHSEFLEMTVGCLLLYKDLYRRQKRQMLEPISFTIFNEDQEKKKTYNKALRNSSFDVYAIRNSS